MPERFLLDTNVAIALMGEEPAAVAHWHVAAEVLLAPPVLAELLFGAARSVRAEENRQRVLAFAARTTWVSVSMAVCQHYADIRLALQKLGRPIPVNDIWIAAICRATGATLASRDQHFDDVPDLVRDDWR